MTATSLQEKNPEKFHETEERYVCGHVQEFRKQTGLHICWLTASYEGKINFLLCENCARALDDITAWRVEYRITDNLPEIFREAQRLGAEVVATSEQGAKAIAAWKKVN